MLVLVIFFMPESAFHRVNALNIDTGVHTVDMEKKEKEEAVAHIEDDQQLQHSPSEPRDPYVKTLKIWSGYWDQVSFWRTLIRPFVVIASPAVIWATLLFTICISWLVLISITLSQIFSGPPYNFSVSEVGATNVSSFVASLLATLIAGTVVDGVAKVMSKHNHGIFGTHYLHTYERLAQSLISFRTRVPPPSHGHVSCLHRNRLLRLGPGAVQGGSLARSRCRMPGHHQFWRPARHHRRRDLRERLPPRAVRRSLCHYELPQELFCVRSHVLLKRLDCYAGRKKHFLCYWRHHHCGYADDDSHVYLWEARAQLGREVRGAG